MTQAVRSTKASFCLANTDAVDYTVAERRLEAGEHRPRPAACGGPAALSLREVLVQRLGRHLHQYRAGQAFRIGDLPNGNYYIAVEANPEQPRSSRRDKTNNDSLRKIRIRRSTGDNRWVRTSRSA